MNANRRHRITKAINRLEEIDSMLSDLQEFIQCINDDEQEAFDNMPESLQYSDRGEAMEEAISNLDDAYGALDGILDDCRDYLEEAMA